MVNQIVVRDWRVFFRLWRKVTLNGKSFQLVVVPACVLSKERNYGPILFFIFCLNNLLLETYSFLLPSVSHQELRTFHLIIIIIHLITIHLFSSLSY